MQHQIIITSGGKFSTLIAEKKNNLIRSVNGRNALAQAMAAPIRRNLDYHGFARKILATDQLDINSAENKNFLLRGRKITIPAFEIVTEPSITIKDIKMRRFSIIDRARSYRYRRKIYIK